MNPITTTLFAAFALASADVALADAKFEHLSVRIEHNATDQDYEIVFEATAGDTGLAKLEVTAPDGRVVIDFKVPNTQLGMRTIRLETPEPRTLAALKTDYPAGEYSFAARTVSGLGFSGTASLNHQLPTTPAIVRPRADEQGVNRVGLDMQWRTPTAPYAVVVTIENDRTGVKVVQATLPGSTTRFAVPDRVLLPGTRYKLAIGTLAEDGNASFAESAFTTASR